MPTAAIGLIASFTILALSIAGGKNIKLLKLFIDIPSLAVVVGCSITAMLTNFSFSEMLKGFFSAKFAFKKPPHDPQEVIEIIIRMAVKARREGMLGLKDETTNGKYPLLDLGAGLLADGTDPEDTAQILETASAKEGENEVKGEKMWRDLSVYAPMFGMVGTLIGLILMLRGLSDPSSIGPAMSLALVTTFYGVVIAGLICLPIAGKIHNYFALKALSRDLIIEGLLCIQAGNNSQIIAEKLKAHLRGSEHENPRQKKA